MTRKWLINARLDKLYEVNILFAQICWKMWNPKQSENIGQFFDNQEFSLFSYQWSFSVCNGNHRNITSVVKANQYLVSVGYCLSFAKNIVNNIIYCTVKDNLGKLTLTWDKITAASIIQSICDSNPQIFFSMAVIFKNLSSVSSFHFHHSNCTTKNDTKFSTL